MKWVLRDTGYRTVVGRLSIIGLLSRVLLVGWNVVMVVRVDQGIRLLEGGGSVGWTIGALAGMTGLVSLWAAGNVVFGVWALLTMPPRMLVPWEKPTGETLGERRERLRRELEDMAGEDGLTEDP